MPFRSHRKRLAPFRDKDEGRADSAVLRTLLPVRFV